MAAINLPVSAQLQNVSQLQRQLQQATQNIRINLVNGNSARSLTALSQPLGRLTGQADEFTKSMDAANARVLAFGASVGIVNTLTNAFKSLISSTIEVEKAITAISVVGDQFAGKNKQLSQGLFSIAKATGQSFQEVSKAALEFSRQGLNLEDTLERTQNALILTRLTGLDAAKSVDGLTAAVNAFSKAGLSTTQIVNKLAAVDQAFAVSSADLIEGFNRSAAVAQNAGVSFDELAGIITALQQETSRGGAVIGNALKTIFTRLQDTSTLNQLKNLGVAVQDLQGNLLPARQILQNLATDVEGLGQVTKAGIFKDVAGTFQINQLISLVSDLNKENSVAAAATLKAAGATNEAFIANEKLNQSLDSILNKIANAGKQFGSLVGEIGLTDGFRELLGYIDTFLEGASKLLQGDDLGAKFAKGLIKGIGSVLTGPGIGIFLAIIAKLGFDLAKFGAQSLKTFFGIGQAARDQQKIQESIVQTLIRNQSVLSQIVNTQGGQNAQAQAFLNILRQEEQALQNIRTLAGGIAAPVIAAGYRTGGQGLSRGRSAAGGYLPAQEASDVRRGVGGASPSSKVVAIPNFAFGGGKRGTMIANTSEYIVPNYAGGGSAIFNQDMARTMGLPSGAKKITAAGGFIPNFSGNTNPLNPKNVSERYALLVNDLESPRLNETVSYKPKDGQKVFYKANIYGVKDVATLTSAEQQERFKSEFNTESLMAKYEKLALEDIEKYSNAVIGEPISPVAGAKLANKGSVPSLVGSIFESAITSALQDADLVEAQLRRDPNAPFDFNLKGKDKHFNKFFGIPNTVDYIEAKYAANDSTKESFASKIDRIESGKYIEKPNIAVSEDLKNKWFKYLNIPGKRSLEAREMYQSIAQDLGFNSTKDRDKINELMNKATGRASGGYIPNFAQNALKAAISRERSAGVSASQIYIDQSPELKSSANPMGLMVANRRDEPAGGFQGISRARKEGMNPKTYGAANGFVPNFFSYSPLSSRYAPAPTPAPAPANTGAANTASSVTQGKEIKDTIGALFGLQIASTAVTGALSEAGENVQKFGTALSSALIDIQSIKELGKTEGGVGFGSNFKTGLSTAKREINAGFLRFGAANRAGSFGGLLKGIGLVSKGLLRFAPLIGQVVLGFDIVNNVLKAFGVDVIKITTDFFRGVNDAGQKARDSITEFTSALDEGTNTISGESSFSILKKRADTLNEELKFKQANIEKPKNEEELKKAREQVLREGVNSTVKRLQNKSISEIIKQAGETETGLRGRGASQTKQVFDKTTITSLSESYIEAIASIERLTEEDVKKLAKINKIEGNSFQETRDNVLKFFIADIDKMLEMAKSGGGSNEEIVTKFRAFSSNRIFARLAEVFDVGKEAAEQFGKRLEQNVQGFLVAENDFFNRQNRKFAESVDFFNSLTSTKTFGSLDIGTQTQNLNALDIGKSQQGFIQRLTGFRAEAASKLKSEYETRALPAALNNAQKTQIEDFILNFDAANIKSFNEGLDNLTESLGGVDQNYINRFKEIANSLSDQQDEILSKRDNELKLLQFTIEERNLETKAIQDYNKNIVNFGRTIFDAEQKIQNFNSQLKILDLQKDFDIAISDAFAPSSQAAFSQRQGIELSNFQQQASIQANIAKEQARIELQKTLVTKDNIIALNRNTSALTELLNIQSLVQENELSKQKNTLADEFFKKIGFAIEDINNLPPLSSDSQSIVQRYDQISNIIKAIGERRSISNTKTNGNSAPTGFKTFSANSVDELIKGYENKILGITDPKQIESAIQEYVASLNYNEEASMTVRDALITYSRSTEETSIAQGRLKTEFEKAQKLERDKNTLLSTYAAAIQKQIQAGEDALLLPQTMGEFAAQVRKNDLAREVKAISMRGVTANEKTNPEEFKRQVGLNDAAVREFLSSGRYGLEEGFIQLEQKTLDFKKELAVEIPQLFSSNLAQGLNDAISGAKSLKDALRDAATSFLNAITQKNIENLANMFTSGIGNVAKGFFQEKASGGLISGGSGTKDDIPAMLMGGEYVIKKSAVKKYGSRFLDSLNNGGVQAFASGGGVQSGKGGFYVPGDFGTGAITGKNQLLEFAGQSFTGGQYDRMGGFGMSGASISLEPESARLTAYGRENSPIFERVQQAKEEAFNVYLDQLKQESAYREQLKQMEEAEKARKKQLKTAIISAVASAAVSAAGSAALSGGKNALGAANQVAAGTGQTLSGWSKFTTFLGGAIGKGGATGTGGLGNLLSGNFSNAVTDFSAIGKNYGAKPNYIFSGGSLRGVNYGGVSLPVSSMGGRSSNSGFSFGSLFGLGKRSYSRTSPIQGAEFDYGGNLYQKRGQNISSFSMSDAEYRQAERIQNSLYGSSYMRGFANGGYITGGSGMRDDVPAMLTGGEFVLNNRATRKLGVQNLNRLNAGATESQQSSGGVSDALISKLDELIQTTRESSKDNVVVNVSGMETGGEKRSDENKSSNDRELQRKIKEAVLAVIAQEKRLGGSLNK